MEWANCDTERAAEDVCKDFRLHRFIGEAKQEPWLSDVDRSGLVARFLKVSAVTGSNVERVNWQEVAIYALNRSPDFGNVIED